MKTQLAITNPNCIGYGPNSAIYEIFCPNCGRKVTLIPQQMSQCECGREWQLQITAVAGQKYEIK